MAPNRGATVDEAEVERFAAIAPEWWSESGAFRPLHRLNPARIEYVRDRLAGHFARDVKTRAPFAGLSLLDIGCGGGLMCEPMARLGFSVTGVDADETAMADKTATGVTFGPVTAEHVGIALRSAHVLFQNKPAWRQIQLNGMAVDVSWRNRASRYANLYRQIVEAHPKRNPA